MYFLTYSEDGRICNAILGSLQLQISNDIGSCEPVHEVRDFGYDANIVGSESGSEVAVLGTTVPAIEILTIEHLWCGLGYAREWRSGQITGSCDVVVKDGIGSGQWWEETLSDTGC